MTSKIWLNIVLFIVGFFIYNIKYILSFFKKSKNINEIKFHEIGEPFCKKTASVDRIDSNKGYEKGNIQIVHKIVNRMKWSLNQKAFIWFCKKIYENNLDINLENSYEDSLY